MIGLGIGRTVYAYRLANGELPESLDALVKTGLLPIRYLAGENETPLRSRREGGFIAVEGTGRERWCHRWQGSDGRRKRLESRFAARSINRFAGCCLKTPLF